MGNAAGRRTQAGFAYHGGGVLSKTRRDGRRVYYIRYSWRGRRITEKVGLSEERARGRIEARREAMEDPAHVPVPLKRKAANEAKRRQITFRKFGQVFLREWASKRASEKLWFRTMVRRLTVTFGSLHLDKISQHRLERFITARRRKVSAATTNHDIRMLKNLFNRAVEWGYLVESPARRLRQIEEPPLRERFLSQEESDRLLKHAPGHLKPVVQAALLTGMRRGELLRMTWEQIDLERRQIAVTSRKGGRVRTRQVAVNDDLAALLEGTVRHIATDHVFTYRGKPLASLKRSWEATRAAAGLPMVRFHDLRHTWASRMVSAGVGLYELMQLGGWSTVAMVQRYARFAPDRMVKTAQLVCGTAGQIEAPARVAALVAGQPSPMRVRARAAVTH